MVLEKVLIGKKLFELPRTLFFCIKYKCYIMIE